MGNKGFLFQVLICVVACGAFLYSYIDVQNAVTMRRLKIPVLAKKVKDIKEENTHLQYEIDLFESPQNLMQLASKSEFSHLKQPMVREILTMQEAVALQVPQEESKAQVFVSQVKFALGAKP